MSFPRATIASAAAWLTDIATDGIATPTDDEIMDRYLLRSVAAARDLLATLAEQSKITLRGAGPERQILIGRPAPKPFETARPTRTVITEAARAAAKDPRFNIDKIRAIGASLTTAREKLGAPPKPVREAVAPAVAARLAPLKDSAKVTPAIRLPAIAPAVAKAADDAAAAAGRKQISCFVPAAAHLELVRRAEGKPMGTYLREQVLAMLSGSASGVSVKPLVPAHITAAAIRDDMPVAAFVAILIARGFASYEADCARELAA